MGGAVVKLGERHGPVVGAMEGLEYGEDEVTLEAGDVLLVYTDGVTEAMTPQSDLYGEPRLEALLAQADLTRPQLLVDAVVADVHVFEDGADQADDITVLACEFHAPRASAALELSMPAELATVGKVLEQFGEWAVELAVADKPRRHVQAALDELLNNTVSYGYGGRQGTGQIDLRIELWDEKRLVVILRDDADPFDPRVRAEVDTEQSIQEREIGGLGLLLVQGLMDNIDYVREDGHNVTTIVKTLEG
jgi:sigma-B regulation protein RsbU (phosphoserine phosphatase)